MVVKTSVDQRAVIWLRPEIRASLRTCGELIRIFSSSKNRDLLTKLLQEIHQINGTLRIVESKSLTSLTTEIEKLVESFIADTIPLRSSAFSVLVLQCFKQLQETIDCLAEGVQENYTTMIQWINKIRRLRNVRETDISNIFSLDINVFPQIHASRSLRDQSYKDRIKDLRNRFQYHMLGLLRQTSDDDSLNLSMICQKAYRISTFGIVARLWWIAHAFTQTLGEQKQSSQHLLILHQLHQYLRQLSTEGEAALLRQSTEDICRQMLYFVAITKIKSAHVMEVRQLFGLENFMAAQENSDVSSDVEEDSTIDDRLDLQLSMLSDMSSLINQSHSEGPEYLEKAAAIAQELASLATQHAYPYVSLTQKLTTALSRQENDLHENLKISIASAILVMEKGIQKGLLSSTEWKEQLSITEKELTGLLEGVDNAPATESSNEHAQQEAVQQAISEAKTDIRSVEKALEKYATGDIQRNGSDINFNALTHRIRCVRGILRILDDRQIDLLLKKTEQQLMTLETKQPGPRDVLTEALATAISVSSEYLDSLSDYQTFPQTVLNRTIFDLDLAGGYTITHTDSVNLLYRSSELLFKWITTPQDYLLLENLRDNANNLLHLARHNHNSEIEDMVNEQIRLIERAYGITKVEGNRDIEALKNNVEALADKLVDLYELGDSSSELNIIQKQLDKRSAIHTSDTVRFDDSTPVVTDLGQKDQTVASPSPENDLFAVFLEECDEITHRIGELIDHYQSIGSADVTDLRREFHTLKGSSRIIGLAYVGELAWYCESLLHDFSEVTDPTWQQILDYCKNALNEIHSQRTNNFAQQHLISVDSWHQTAESIIKRQITPGITPDLWEIFTSEATEKLQKAQQALNQPDINTSKLAIIIHTLHGNALALKLPQMAACYRLAEQLVESRKLSHDHIKTLQEMVKTSQELATLDTRPVETTESRFNWEAITKQFESHLEDSSEVGEVLQELDQIDDLLNEDAQLPSGIDIDDLEEPLEKIQQNLRNITTESDETVEEVGDTPRIAPETGNLPYPELLRDLTELHETTSLKQPLALPSEDEQKQLQTLFSQELESICVEIEQQLASLYHVQDLASSTGILLRYLHTLKGSARVAGFTLIGDLSHAMESYLKAVTVEEDHQLESVRNALERFVDHLPSMLESPGADSITADTFDSVLVDALLKTVPATNLPSSLQHLQSQQVITSMESVEGDEARENVERDDAIASKSQQPGMELKVRPQILDDLSGAIGDSSANLSELSRSISGMRQVANYFSENISSFGTQLNELEIEVETRITSRVNTIHDNEKNIEFDPLELDRYTRIQQLSRQLTERLDELVNIRDKFNANIESAEDVLRMQGQINHGLQDNLLQIRLVPFAKLEVPLRRLVRAIGRDLNKKVDFEMRGRNIKIDTVVLETVTPALEHMLRNSIDHGIENPHERKQQGKPENATIRIQCEQAGQEIVLSITDDGRGLDIDKIKKDAISSNLIDPDDPFTIDDAMYHITRPGFTTASTVTQISGRGVGMDIVQNVMQRLGGSLSYQHRNDKEYLGGATFILRLPISLAVTAALFVEVGGREFAIPARMIAGVATLSGDEIRRMREKDTSGDSVFLKQGEREYRIIFATDFVGINPSSFDNVDKMSVVIVDAGVNSIAVPLDKIGDTEEIVVRDLGQHLSPIPYYAGATVRADGKIVLLLNLVGLSFQEAKINTPVSKTGSEKAVPTIMVVDDSLTVRKSLQRDIANLGLNVALAKNGLDALSSIQSVQPDLILLDIEMPEMDGFEFLRWLRKNDDYTSLPVIIISSRVAEKHRQKGAELGCNAYLSKPYIMDDLVAEIERLIHLP